MFDDTRVCKMCPNCIVSDYDCTICAFYGGRTKKTIKCLANASDENTDCDYEDLEERSNYGG